MTKKRKLPWIWIGIVIVLLIAGVLVFGNKFFEKKTTNQQQASQQKPCTANTTLSCSDGSVIITQECTEGKLISTGKICPCTTNTTITCSNGDVIITQECINGTLKSTGKRCPCISDNILTCYDGSTVITQNCVNGTLINTGNACPPQPAPIPIELNAQKLQTLFQRSEYFIRLPNNAAILLDFYDASTQMRPEKFFVSGGGLVKNYEQEKYDLEFTIADFRLARLEAASDLCAELRKIKEEQNMRADIKNIFSIGKYLYLKDCVPFSI